MSPSTSATASVGGSSSCVSPLPVHHYLERTCRVGFGDPSTSFEDRSWQPYNRTRDYPGADRQSGLGRGAYSSGPDDTGCTPDPPVGAPEPQATQNPLSTGTLSESAPVGW